MTKYYTTGREYNYTYDSGVLIMDENQEYRLINVPEDEIAEAGEFLTQMSYKYGIVHGYSGNWEDCKHKNNVI